MTQATLRRPVGSSHRPTFPSFTIEPLTPTFVGEITGIDLSEPISPALAGDLRSAVESYHVLVIRDQHLDADQQEAFSRCFGEVQEHVGRLRDGSRLTPVHEISNVDEGDRPTDKPQLHATAYWHTDGAHFAIPPSFTILHAVQLPPAGGDTEFADMIGAYESLPESKRAELEGLTAVHSYGEKHLNIGGPAGKPEEVRDAPPVSHPIVRTHAPTGKKALYIGMYAVRMPDRPDEAARAFLQDLLVHATQPQFLYAQRWRPGDLVMWDNRCVLHRALGNFDMRAHKRILRRTVVKGTPENRAQPGAGT
ncbi:MAG: TauD/TfdA dioxygenase family protein [Lautropia sp.]